MDVIDRVPGLGVSAGAGPPAHGRRAHPPLRVRARARRGPARGGELGLAALMRRARRERRFEQPQAADRRARRRRRGEPGSRRLERRGDAGATSPPSSTRRRGRRGRPPRRARRRRVHGAGAGHDRGRAQVARASSPLAPLHQPRAVAGMRALARPAPGSPAGRVLRHCVPRDDAGGRHRPTHSRRRGASGGGFVASVFTAFRTRTRPSGSPRSRAGPATRVAQSCAAISGRARRCARRSAAVRSTPRWAGHHSKGW